jgi:hypothetical protein
LTFYDNKYDMTHDETPAEELERWIDRFKRHFKEILINTLGAGTSIFLVSNAILFIGIGYFPEFFVNYLSPEFNSEGDRDFLFYAHPFVLAHSLSILWNRFQKYFSGNIFKTGFEFGVLYAVIALVPILWITYAAMEVSLPMVLSWLFYGLIQSVVAGVVLSFLRKKMI